MNETLLTGLQSDTRRSVDPRPDLVDDTVLWGPLLESARARFGDRVYGVLHAVRALGARLERDDRGLRLVPGEISGDEYADLRERWLRPHADPLRRLLRSGWWLFVTIW
jgi:hypothetical protein